MKIKSGYRIFLTLFILGFFVWPAVSLAQAAADAPAAPAAATQNAAENINVDLKVPLPFVPTKCKTTVIDPNDNAKTITVPAVCNLKDYIEGVYRLLIGVGALFAVVMIIIAGYQYLTSGGSADKTGSAKKRIWNACIGLVLALMSYVILNAISSRLVDLRLPQVAPVQKFTIDPNNFCQTSDEVQKVYNKLPPAEQSNFLSDVKAGPLNFLIKKEDALCGSKYYINAGGGKSGGQCDGNKCAEPPGSSCIMGKCRDALVWGTIEWLPADGFVDYITLYPVCGDGLMGEASDRNTVEKSQLYRIPNPFMYYEGNTVPVYQVRADYCKENLRKEFKGYVLKVEVNNDCWPDYIPVDDDDFMVGRSCNTPIHQGNKYKPSDIDWKLVDKSELLQIEDFVGADGKPKAFQCDLVINRREFPVPYQTGSETLGITTSCQTR